MSLDQLDAHRELELHHEAVRIAVRELHASTGPLERRLRAEVQQRIDQHTVKIADHVQRFAPDIIVTGLPDPYAAPARPRFGLHD